jgi:formylmethanofuran dehydrogenase subunit C
LSIKLHLKKEVKAPVNAECISPDVFAKTPVNEIAMLQLQEGNRKRRLDEIFEIEGKCGKTPDEVTIYLIGDLSKFKRVGSGMTGGTIEVQGDVGMHVGEEMNGGTIRVQGNAGSWLGSRMKNGAIEVQEDAGNYIGGAYRGSKNGMRGGVITIHGNAGTEVGSYMRNGLIKIHGNVDQFLGICMRNGTIIVEGDSGERPGAFMTGGKIILFGHIPSILPTFTIHSMKRSVKVKQGKIKQPFYLFIGDLSEHGNGKLYVSKNMNAHFKGYENLL